MIEYLLGGSVIIMDKLSGPLTALINRIYDARECRNRPLQIVQEAKAEAEAEVIRAEAQIKVMDKNRQAAFRWLKEEAKKQENMDQIMLKAGAHLDEDKSRPNDIEDDWITNFFEKCRIVSNEEMQQLWSKVLAGQSNAPGSFSRQTVNLLANLDKADAELFTRLCGFNWTGIGPIVFDLNDEIYSSSGVTFTAMSHLESLGLIHFNALAGFRLEKIPRHESAIYFFKKLALTFPMADGNVLDIGKVLLTRAGRELASVCSAEPVNGFFDYVCVKWSSMVLELKQIPDPADAKID